MRPTSDAWGDWQKPVLCRRLLREVDDLMRSRPPPRL